MAFDVSALNAYVNEHRSELMSAAVLAFKSSQYFQPMPETKGPTTLNLLSAPVTFQSGESCGFNASGNVSFTQRVLTPGALKVNESFCPDALRKYYMQNEVNIGAGRETMPFEEKVLALIVKKIGEAMEVAFWQGDKTNGTGNNAFFDGLHTILKADCGANPTVIPSANKVTAGSSDTIYDRVKALAEMVPDAMGNKMNFYMSTKNFRKLSLIITNSNMYHYQRDIDSENLTMIFPGWVASLASTPSGVSIPRKWPTASTSRTMWSRSTSGSARTTRSSASWPSGSPVCSTRSRRMSSLASPTAVSKPTASNGRGTQPLPIY